MDLYFIHLRTYRLAASGDARVLSSFDKAYREALLSFDMEEFLSRRGQFDLRTYVNAFNAAVSAAHDTAKGLVLSDPTDGVQRAFYALDPSLVTPITRALSELSISGPRPVVAPHVKKPAVPGYAGAAKSGGAGEVRSTSAPSATRTTRAKSTSSGSAKMRAKSPSSGSASDTASEIRTDISLPNEAVATTIRTALAKHATSGAVLYPAYCTAKACSVCAAAFQQVAITPCTHPGAKCPGEWYPHVPKRLWRTVVKAAHKGGPLVVQTTGVAGLPPLRAVRGPAPMSWASEVDLTLPTAEPGSVLANMPPGQMTRRMSTSKRLSTESAEDTGTPKRVTRSQQK